MASFNSRPIIIAEAGVNHDGSYEKAIELIDIAAEAGADYIKFQTFQTDKLVAFNTPSAEYQKRNCGENNQRDLLKRLELSYSDFKNLKNHCEKRNIGFLSSPFDSESLHFLLDLGMDYIKIPSGEITNLPFLREISNTHIPVILSTGMSTIEEIKNAILIFTNKGYNASNLIILHCNTQYPTPFKDVNLFAMKTMADYFGLPTGYSDHTPGIETSIAATALGAVLIEKHFTLEKSSSGPDHIASLKPDELKKLVKSICHVSEALGSHEKFVTESEKENIIIARKSIVAKKQIKKDEILTSENLTVKRPGKGLSPMLWDEIIGTKAKKDFETDELIEI